jgi:hypothetical protein
MSLRIGPHLGLDKSEDAPVIMFLVGFVVGLITAAVAVAAWLFIPDTKQDGQL